MHKPSPRDREFIDPFLRIHTLAEIGCVLFRLDDKTIRLRTLEQMAELMEQIRILVEAGQDAIYNRMDAEDS